jgi:hypothetical protein
MENDQTCEVQTMDSPAFGFWGCRGLSLDVVRPVIRPCFSVFFCVFDRELARPNHAHRDRIGSKESLFGYRTEIRRSETKLRICYNMLTLDGIFLQPSMML